MTRFNRNPSRSKIKKGKVMPGMKTILTACMVSTLLAGSAFAEGKRVTFVDGPLSDKFIASLTKGITDPAKADGLSVNVVQSPFDPALQAQQLDDAIAQKVDLIIVMPMSQKAIVPALTRARDAHIPVVVVVTQVEDPNLYTAFVGEDPVQLGEVGGRAMGEALKAAGRTSAKVAIVAGSMDEGLAPARAAGFKKGLAAFPGVTVVATEETHWAPPEAERAAGQLLARFSAQGGLDGIYGMNDALANGVIQGAEGAGMKLGTAKGDLIVVGGNCMAPGVSNIDRGKQQATTSLIPAKIGAGAEAAAVAILAGKPVTKVQLQLTEEVTKANLAQWRKVCTY
jgi:ribose transport system substrate-binding protein